MVVEPNVRQLVLGGEAGSGIRVGLQDASDMPLKFLFDMAVPGRPPVAGPAWRYDGLTVDEGILLVATRVGGPPVVLGVLVGTVDALGGAIRVRLTVDWPGVTCRIGV